MSDNREDPTLLALVQLVDAKVDALTRKVDKVIDFRGHVLGALCVLTVLSPMMYDYLKGLL